MTDPTATPHDLSHAPIAEAIRRGALADDLGEAFFAGYQAALLALVPGLRGPAALAVTEATGNHPRAIATAAVTVGDSVRLDGQKAFVTGADRARTLLVAAREGERADGTPRIVVMLVPADSPGLTFEALPPTPFAPGIGHAKVTLADVRVPRTARVGEDGYRDVVKPFRTVEDIHVVAALASHLVARLAPVRGESADRASERLEAALASLETLAGRDPTAPATHRALAGTLALVREWVEPALTALTDSLEPEVLAALHRDRALLRVAERAREARTQAAHLARLERAAHR